MAAGAVQASSAVNNALGSANAAAANEIDLNKDDNNLNSTTLKKFDTKNKNES